MFASSNMENIEEKTVCCVIQSAKYFITPIELGQISSQIQEIFNSSTPSKPIRIVLPQWVSAEEFLYILDFYRKENLFANSEIDSILGIKIFKLARFLINKEIQQYAISKLILPKLNISNIYTVLTEVYGILQENNNDEFCEKLLKGVIKIAGNIILNSDLKDRENLLSKIKSTHNKYENLVEDILEEAYCWAISKYETDKIQGLIDFHLLATGESNIVSLFTKRLKKSLEKALNSIQSQSDQAFEWIVKTDIKSTEQKSCTLIRGTENFHFIFSREERTNKYQLFLASGQGEDHKHTKMSRFLSNNVSQRNLDAKTSKSTIISQRSCMNSPKNCLQKVHKFPKHLGFSTSCLRGGYSKKAIEKKNQHKSSRSFNASLTDISQELASLRSNVIKLSAEASSAITMNTGYSMRSQLLGKVLILVSYIELGSKDNEAKMNIHYINTNDKRILVKTRNIKEFPKNERNIPIKIHLIYSYTVSALLDYILKNFEDLTSKSLMSGLSHHQLLFLTNNARKNSVPESVLAEAILKWCDTNSIKCPVENSISLLKKINWKKVPPEKVKLLRNMTSNQKILAVLPGGLSIHTNIQTPFSEISESRVSTNKSFCITNTANTPIRIFLV